MKKKDWNIGKNNTKFVTGKQFFYLTYFKNSSYNSIRWNWLPFNPIGFYSNIHVLMNSFKMLFFLSLKKWSSLVLIQWQRQSMWWWWWKKWQSYNDSNLLCMKYKYIQFKKIVFFERKKKFDVEKKWKIFLRIDLIFIISIILFYFYEIILCLFITLPVIYVRPEWTKNIDRTQWWWWWWWF